MEQLDLLSMPSTEDQSIEARFWCFHNQNPDVYTELVRMAKQVQGAGATHYGIKALFESLRFTRMITHGEKFKLNNNYTAHYARLIMHHEPGLRGFFETREVQ